MKFHILSIDMQFTVVPLQTIYIIVIIFIIKIRPKCKKSTERLTESRNKTNFFFFNNNIGKIASPCFKDIDGRRLFNARFEYDVK